MIFRALHILALSLLLCGQLACDIQAEPPKTPFSIKSSLPNCRPNAFPFEEGWLGADVAYSIPLKNGSTLWLFGDTFIASLEEPSREAAIMIGNSVAVSRCEKAGEGSLRYDWRTQWSSPRAVFQPKSGNSRFWPQDGFEHNGALYITLVEIAALGEGPLGFEAKGTTLAKVTNYLAPADEWHIELTPLIEGKVLLGVSIVKDQEYAYFFTWVDTPAPIYSSPAVLARIQLSELDKPRESLEYLSKRNEWLKGLDTSNALAVLERGMTEMSVRFHGSHNMWVAVMPEHKFPSGNIIVQTSPSMLGPWTAPRIVYSAPEMLSSNVLFDPETFCYAAKEHIQFEKDDALTITYACSSFNGAKQAANTNLYTPQVVNVAWDCVLGDCDKH